MNPIINHLQLTARMATLTAGLVSARDGYRCVGCGALLVSHKDTRPPEEQVAVVDGHRCRRG